MKRDVTVRYTDSHLIHMLINMTLEHTKGVSNRDIIADPAMPTHHTFVNRFGSLAKAKQVAKIENSFEDRDYNSILDYLADMLRGEGHDVVRNFRVKTKDDRHDLTVPLAIVLHDQKIAIDIIPENPSEPVKIVMISRADELTSLGYVHQTYDIFSLGKNLINLVLNKPEEEN